MTDQITVPRATWDALREALTPELVRQWGELKTMFMGNGDSHEVVVITLARLRHLFDAALTAANAVTSEYSEQPQAQWDATNDACEVLATVMHFIPPSEPDLMRDVSVLCHNLRTCAHPQATEPAVKESLTTQDIDTCRQWFDSVQDTNGGYLTPADYLLADKIYRTLGMRVPSSITNTLTAAPEAKQ